MRCPGMHQNNAGNFPQTAEMLFFIIGFISSCNLINHQPNDELGKIGVELTCGLGIMVNIGGLATTSLISTEGISASVERGVYSLSLGKIFMLRGKPERSSANAQCDLSINCKLRRC